MKSQDQAARAAGGRGRGRPRPTSESRTTTEQRQRIRAWFAGRLPAEWSVSAPDISVDDEEILVVAHLEAVALPAEASEDERLTAAAARITGFREDTRAQRMRIAEEAQSAFGRLVSWGADAGEHSAVFTSASVPVMTRLRIGERQVLDTLIDAGIARSRSEALAWCVKLVGEHEEQWINDLRAAFEHVAEVRARGPKSSNGG